LIDKYFFIFYLAIIILYYFNLFTTIFFNHLFMLRFEQAAGVPRFVHVPFPGVAPLIPQLLGGHMDMAAVNVGDGLALVREGKLRLLAQAAERRQPEAPDTPTFRELGLDVVMGASRGESPGGRVSARPRSRSLTSWRA
jgi:tripartite-type tricarboxylate transporter receptor subunit TctC